MINITRRAVLTSLSVAAAVRPERTFAAWPERSITMMHGSAPEGGVDLSARLMA